MTTDVAARLARWRESHDPADLWPGVTPGHLRAAQILIGEVTQRLVTTDGRATLHRPEDMPARIVGIAAMAAGMGPLLGHWLEHDRLTTDDATAALLLEHLRHGRARAGRLRAGVAPFVRAALKRGVPIVALKGVHTAWAYFPEPGARPLGDVDLLAPAAYSEAAREVLRELSFTEATTNRLPNRSDWRPHGASDLPTSLEMTHVDNPWSIDLHSSLHHEFVPGVLGRLPLPPLDACATTEIDGSPVLVLPQPTHLVYLALHTSADLNTVQLMRLVELAWVARADFQDVVSWHAFRSLVEETGVQRLVYPALALTQRLVPDAVDATTLTALEAAVPGRMRRYVRRLDARAPQSLYHRSLVGDLIWVSGPVEAARWLAARALGSGHALETRSLSRRLKTLRRRARDLVWGRIRLGG